MQSLIPTHAADVAHLPTDDGSRVAVVVPELALDAQQSGRAVERVVVALRVVGALEAPQHRRLRPGGHKVHPGPARVRRDAVDVPQEAPLHLLGAQRRGQRARECAMVAVARQ